MVIGPQGVDEQDYVNTLIKDSGFEITQLIDPMHDGVSFRALVWALHNGINVLHIPVYNKDNEAQIKALCDEADALIVVLDNRSRKSTAIYNEFKKTLKPIYEVKRRK